MNNVNILVKINSVKFKYNLIVNKNANYSQGLHLDPKRVQNLYKFTFKRNQVNKFGHIKQLRILQSKVFHFTFFLNQNLSSNKTKRSHILHFYSSAGFTTKF